MTPTARSIEYLRERGWIACRVEQTLVMPGRPFANKKDAFGFGDILAANPIEGKIALIQATGGQGGNLMARVRRIINGELDDKKIPFLAIDWIRGGGRIYCHGWAKRKPRGVKRPRWTLKIKKIELMKGPQENFLCSLDVIE